MEFLAHTYPERTLPQTPRSRTITRKTKGRPGLRFKKHLQATDSCGGGMGVEGRYTIQLISIDPLLFMV